MTYKQARRAERNSRIVELARSGTRYDVIADRVALTPARVSQVMRAQGEYRRGPYRRTP